VRWLHPCRRLRRVGLPAHADGASRRARGRHRGRAAARRRTGHTAVGCGFLGTHAVCWNCSSCKRIRGLASTASGRAKPSR
jgi:hypothetical protein